MTFNHNSCPSLIDFPFYTCLFGICYKGKRLLVLELINNFVKMDFVDGIIEDFSEDVSFAYGKILISHRFNEAPCTYRRLTVIENDTEFFELCKLFSDAG